MAAAVRKQQPEPKPEPKPEPVVKERTVKVTVELSPSQHAFLGLRSYAETGVFGGPASKGAGVKGMCERILHTHIDREIEKAQAKEAKDAGSGKSKSKGR